LRSVDVGGSLRARSAPPRSAALFAALLCAALAAPGEIGGQEPPAPVPGAPTADCGLEGTVVRQDGTPIAGATVRVRGVEGRASTGPDGRYRIAGLPAGPDRVVEISGAGIEPESRLVTLVAGRTSTLDIEIISEGDEILVTDKRLDASIAKQQLERRYSAVVEDNIGAEEISKTTASNVADAVQQLPAVTIIGGRFAYVRGLGDRYSQTLLDGATLPSPEPDKRVVPLDLFPVGMIESVSVAKTYSPELPGEFAGGSVQATTVGVPVAGFLEFSFSGKYTDGTTFQDFTTYEGGNLDWLGYDDGTREIPGEVPSSKVTGGTTGLTPLQLQEIGRSFQNVWTPDTITAPIDKKLGLSFGDSWEFGDLGRLGLIGSGHWSNKYQTVEDEEFNLIFVNSFDELTAFNQYEYDTSTFEAELAGVLSATLEMSPAQSITWRNLYSHSSSDRVREQTGFDGQQAWEVEITQLKYVERLLFNSQLSGEHLLIGDMLARWRAGKSFTERDQPDTRQNLYAEEIAGSGEFVWQDSSASGTHDYYYLQEDVTDLGFDLAIPFNPFDIDDPHHDPLALEPGQYVKIGAAVLRRDRDFDTRRFRYIPTSVSGTGPVDEDGNPIDLTLSPEELFDPDNISPQGFVIDEVTRPTDNYEAMQELDAAYASLSFRVHPKVRLAGGARVESSLQEVRTFELFGSPPQETTAELDDTDWLPALNVTWEFAKDQQLRLGASRTVSRPEFRELAEFEYTDIEGGYAVRGNPDLERALLSNLDLRWEWYPTVEELVSISLFGKLIDQPIEQVNLPTGSALITSFENADSAEIYGIELEGRKQLGFLGSAWDPFSLRGNVALIESEVKSSDNPLAIQTNDERPLQGQPEWTANLGIFYSLPTRGLDAGILANAFGERISAVGSGGTPDEYEQTRVQLDFTVSKSLGNDQKVRLSIENILNSEYLYEVGGETSRSYKTGFSVGISYSVEL